MKYFIFVFALLTGNYFCTLRAESRDAGADVSISSDIYKYPVHVSFIYNAKTISKITDKNITEAEIILNWEKIFDSLNCTIPDITVNKVSMDRNLDAMCVADYQLTMPIYNYAYYVDGYEINPSNMTVKLLGNDYKLGSEGHLKLRETLEHMYDK